MIIGLRTVEIFIPQSQSLKEKRMVLRRIKDKVKSNLNVSYAEVDHHDKWQRTSLSFVTVANKRSHVDKRMDQVMEIILTDDRIQLLNVESDYL